MRKSAMVKTENDTAASAPHAGQKRSQYTATDCARGRTCTGGGVDAHVGDCVQPVAALGVEIPVAPICSRAQLTFSLLLCQVFSRGRAKQFSFRALPEQCHSALKDQSARQLQNNWHISAHRTDRDRLQRPEVRPEAEFQVEQSQRPKSLSIRKLRDGLRVGCRIEPV